MPPAIRPRVPAAVVTVLVLVGGLVAVASGPPPTGDASPGFVAVAKKKPACSVGKRVTAEQVVVVRSRGQRATVKACRRTDSGQYVLARGPYQGWVGRNGVAPKGAKREGDGRTPSGTFKLRGGFGAYKNPGVRFGWFKTDHRDVWVDDSRSRYYNLHKRGPANGRWSSAERLRAMVPAYNYAQVIGYNEKRTPGRGSAIFLHVSTGGPTAGCVSLRQPSLLKILRWEKRGAVISIKRR